MLTWLFKAARYAFDQAMKDADQGDRGGRKWDAQISGCTAVLARDLDPGIRADILHKRGDAYYEKAVFVPPRDGALLNFALADYEEAIRLNPNNALAYCGRARVHQERMFLTGDKTRSEMSEMSIADYSEAIRLDPRLAKAFYGRAVLWGEWGDEKHKWRDAKDKDKYFEDIDKAIELEPRNGNYLWARSMAMRRIGRLGSAIDDISKVIANNPQEARMARKERAVLYEKKGLLDKALADWNVLIKECRARADIADAFFLLLVCRANVYIKMGKLKLVLDDCNEAIDRCRKKGDEWKAADAPAHAFNTRGVANAIQGNIAKAIDDFSEAIRLRPDMGVALANRGDVYEKEGKLNEALADFDSARRAVYKFHLAEEHTFIPARAPNGSEPSEAYERVKRALGV